MVKRVIIELSLVEESAEKTNNEIQRFMGVCIGG
jgi:hypothetical protein